MRLALTALVFLLLAPAAHADHGRELDNQLTLSSLVLAQQHWGSADPTCRPHVAYLEGAEPFIGAMATIGDCKIWVSPQIAYPRTAAGRALYCSAIAHEYGHNLGHQHTTETTSIMRPHAGPLTPGCLERYRPCGKRRSCRKIRSVAARWRSLRI